jgi:hypothetical protein
LPVLAPRMLRLGLGRRIHRPLRPAIDRRLRQHVIIEQDRLMFAPLGVAAAPFLGNRIPVGAGFLLERRTSFLILSQKIAVCGDRLRRGRLRHCAGGGRRKCANIHRHRMRRDQQQRERNAAISIANRLRVHRLVVASARRKSALKILPEDVARRSLP